MASTSKRPSVRKTSTKSSSRLKSQVGGSSLARNKKPSLFSKRNGFIVAVLAAIVGLMFVAFSQAAEINPTAAAARKLPIYGTGYKVDSSNCRKPDDALSYGIRSENYGAGKKYRCVYDPWGPSYWTRRVSYLICNNQDVYRPYNLPSGKWTTCRNKYR